LKGIAKSNKKIGRENKIKEGIRFLEKWIFLIVKQSEFNRFQRSSP
jgi:hypothetical protein